jgi:hypothetical protein
VGLGSDAAILVVNVYSDPRGGLEGGGYGIWGWSRRRDRRHSEPGALSDIHWLGSDRWICRTKRVYAKKNDSGMAQHGLTHAHESAGQFPTSPLGRRTVLLAPN